MVASMIKFFGGPIAGFLTGLPIRQTILLSAAGMILAVIGTTIFTKTIQKFLEKRPKTKKIFTARSRFTVRIWNKLGLFGIAFLTPILFTPIGGTLLAISLKANIYRMIVFMIISALFWGVIVSWLVYKLTFISDLLH
jgi:hypothetical protein